MFHFMPNAPLPNCYVKWLISVRFKNMKLTCPDYSKPKQNPTHKIISGSWKKRMNGLNNSIYTMQKMCAKVKLYFNFNQSETERVSQSELE